jgi:hypothetical protein
MRECGALTRCTPQKTFYSRNIVFNESTMFTSDLSTNFTNNPETHNVHVEKVDDYVDAARPYAEIHLLLENLLMLCNLHRSLLLKAELGGR